MPEVAGRDRTDDGFVRPDIRLPSRLVHGCMKIIQAGQRVHRVFLLSLRMILFHSIRLILLLVLAVGGCASARPLAPGYAEVAGASPTLAASVEIGDKERSDGRFIGLAMSGGGSRAAVFGAAVLKELERLGLLQQVDVISAVSGGALPAAYYALDGYRSVDFAKGFLDRMSRDFQSKAWRRWWSPANVLRYWFTDKTKSDTVIEMLDEELFQRATYADLNPARPKLLLNAANALNGEPFIIADESFASLGLSLAPFSIARAVYMSAAYPGVLEPLALHNGASTDGGQARTPALLYDGGAVDNLGIKTLLTVLNRAAEREPLENQFPNGCLFISVDASPRFSRDDGQPLPAATVLLKSNRREVLERVGLPADRQDRARFGGFAVGTENRQGSCRIWHLALRQLPDSDPLGAKVTSIATTLKIDAEDREALVTAAKRLVEESRAEAYRSGDLAQFLRSAIIGESFEGSASSVTQRLRASRDQWNP